MNLTQDKMAYGALGSLAIGAVALSFVLNLTPETTQTFPVSEQRIEPAQEPREQMSSKVVELEKSEPLTAPDEVANESAVSSEGLEEVVVTGARTNEAQEDLSSAAVSADQSMQQQRNQVPPTITAPRMEYTPEISALTASEEEIVVTGARLKRGELKDYQSADIVADQSRQQRSRLLAQKQQEEFAPAPKVAAITESPVVQGSITLPERDDAAVYLPGQPLSRPDGGEEYASYEPNPIVRVDEQPVSTFSIDVDTASYALIRSQLNSGFLPKPQAVRAEEMINYFDYAYPLPKSTKQPFSAQASVSDSPWNEGRKLIHIGIQGYELAPENQPDSNLVFLLDVSGSMNQANKLPLVKQSMGLLLDSLKPSDTVAIAVYAGAAGTVLEPTKVKDKQKILNALNNLSAGGSTAGGQGLRLAYGLAEQNFDKDAVNRIILATDGDFNVGQSSNEDLKTLVERNRDKGVFLSVLGFGRNNYQGDMMQTLAQNGNGVAAYIDTLNEARKVLVDQASSTLFTIAKDVKIQVEFNPATVEDYRLVGYETRALQREDFNNDKVDAGDIGAGHSVTAIYEITPAGSSKPSSDPLRYGDQAEAPTKSDANEYGFLKIRYKLPDEDESILISTPITIEQTALDSERGFAVAVAGFAQLLSNSSHTGSLSFDDVIQAASKHKGEDAFGYRTEFIQLVRQAKIAQP